MTRDDPKFPIEKQKLSISDFPIKIAIDLYYNPIMSGKCIGNGSNVRKMPPYLFYDIRVAINQSKKCALQ